MAVPRVSIIIPNYNNAEYLPDCIESVIAQSYKDIEIIIVDDCSTDDGAGMRIIEDAARRDSRIKIVKRPENGGVGAARNIGIDAARGEFIAFLDSDDCFFTNTIESMVGAADANHADIVVGRYSFVSDSFSWNPTVASGSVGGYIMMASSDMPKFVRMIDFGVAPVVCWGKLFKREVLGDLRFNTDIYPNEDVDFMMRVYSKMAGHIGVLVEFSSVFYRRSRNSIIGTGLNPRFVEGWRRAILSATKYIARTSESQPDNDALYQYRRFFARWVFVMLQSMLISRTTGDIGRSMDKAVRDLYMAGTFDVADITPRVRFGLKLYVSGLKRLSRHFLIFNMKAIGRL
ncbi:MAG: glycosyltransferase [Alphaproteobacteria bacterium]|nr:glycosyltransferase [Alphaproteobacteria bacterium]